MKVSVHVWKPESNDDNFDLFAPFAAVDDARFIAMRGMTEEDAADNVIGAVLCALGQKQHPPRTIEFTVKKGKPAR
ncbi:MAG TPA: hypothetical protein VFA98_13195 [Thermoanaerobaculia bacterium]|nr:hypothetical protein [Thermoanaerobaculia bacterium]